MITRGNCATIGGGIFNRATGNLTLVNSAVRNNTAAGRGGGIFNRAGGRLTLHGTTVRNNTSSGQAGPNPSASIVNQAATGNVVLWASSVTNNKPDNCVNVTGCGAAGARRSKQPGPR